LNPTQNVIETNYSAADGTLTRLFRWFARKRHARGSSGSSGRTRNCLETL